MPSEKTTSAPPVPCGFCYGEPVGNASHWIGGDGPATLPCPRCGVTTPPGSVTAETAAAAGKARADARRKADRESGRAAGLYQGRRDRTDEMRVQPVTPGDPASEGYAIGYSQAIRERSSREEWEAECS